MNGSLRSMSRVLAMTCMLALAPLPPVAMTAVAADQSLADWKYALQISDNDPSKQSLILNVAGNLLKEYPPGAVDVEVVAFGPGLRLLFANNENARRIDDLAVSGVRFAACGNTLKGVAAQLGEAPKISASAKVVPAGIARLGELAKQGYLVVKP